MKSNIIAMHSVVNIYKNNLYLNVSSQSSGSIMANALSRRLRVSEFDSRPEDSDDKRGLK